MTTRRRKLNTPHDRLEPPAQTSFAVVLRVGTRERLYSRFRKRAEAELIVSRMRQHGFDARLVESLPQGVT